MLGVTTTCGSGSKPERLERGGWLRHSTIEEIPKDLLGVDFGLTEAAEPVHAMPSGGRPVVSRFVGSTKIASSPALHIMETPEGFGHRLGGLLSSGCLVLIWVHLQGKFPIRPFASSTLQFLPNPSIS